MDKQHMAGQPADEARWRAVVERDAGADGFVYAVTTTGVYCRPGCPSRRPGRSNVRFFDDPALAEAAGFRPCLRCRPGDGTIPGAERTAAVLDACRRLEQDAAEGGPGLSLAELAGGAGLSPFHFQRLFKRVLGVSPKAYRDACRAGRLRQALAGGRDVTGAVYEAGFGSPSRVYERTGALLGMSPGAYRAGGRGERIRHAAARTSLGWLLVAATDKGVCSAELGDDPDGLLDRLRSRFPKADLAPDNEPSRPPSAGSGPAPSHAPDLAPARGSSQASPQAGPAHPDQERAGGLGGWLRAVVAAIEEPGSLQTSRPDIPLDVRGTAFQHRVWQALRDIPAGRTASYSELAARIGRPEAARAVARACAGNAVAVVVPCHRAVGKDGSLTGYRWGLDRKRALLDREREPDQAPARPDVPPPDWQI